MHSLTVWCPLVPLSHILTVTKWDKKVKSTPYLFGSGFFVNFNTQHLRNKQKQHWFFRAFEFQNTRIECEPMITYRTYSSILKQFLKEVTQVSCVLTTSRKQVKIFQTSSILDSKCLNCYLL